VGPALALSLLEPTVSAGNGRIPCARTIRERRGRPARTAGPCRQRRPRPATARTQPLRAGSCTGPLPAPGSTFRRRAFRRAAGDQRSWPATVQASEPVNEEHSEPSDESEDSPSEGSRCNASRHLSRKACRQQSGHVRAGGYELSACVVWTSPFASRWRALAAAPQLLSQFVASCAVRRRSPWPAVLTGKLDAGSAAAKDARIVWAGEAITRRAIEAPAARKSLQPPRSREPRRDLRRGRLGDTRQVRPR